MGIESGSGFSPTVEAPSVSFGGEGMVSPSSISTPTLGGEFSLSVNSFSGHEFSSVTPFSSNPSVAEGPLNMGNYENVFGLPRMEALSTPNFDKTADLNIFSATSLIENPARKLESSFSQAPEFKPGTTANIFNETVPYKTSIFETYDKTFKGDLKEGKWETIFAPIEEKKMFQARGNEGALKDFVAIKIEQKALDKLTNTDNYLKNSLNFLQDYFAVYPGEKPEKMQKDENTDLRASKSDFSKTQESSTSELINISEDKSESLIGHAEEDRVKEVNFPPQIGPESVEEVILDMEQAAKVMEIAKDLQGVEKATELAISSLHEKIERNGLEQTLNYFNYVLEELEEKRKEDKKNKNFAYETAAVKPDEEGKNTTQEGNIISQENVAKTFNIAEIDREVLAENETRINNTKLAVIQIEKITEYNQNKLDSETMPGLKPLNDVETLISPYVENFVETEKKQKKDEKKLEETENKFKKEEKKIPVFYERDIPTDETRKNIFENVVFSSFAKRRALASDGYTDKLSISGEEFVQRMPSAEDQPKYIKSELIKEEQKKDGSYSAIIEKMSEWKGVASEFVALIRMKILIKAFPSVKVSFIEPNNEQAVKKEDVKRVESNKSPKKASLNPLADLSSL